MDRAEYSSIFGFDGRITIVSYVPKPNHAVLALSTTHHDMQTEGEKQKPVIITHYNQTKSDVDNLDHLAGLFSVKLKTSRWPLVLFFNILDVGAIASFVIWIASYPDWQKLRRASRRRKFLVKLGTDLVEDEINRRLQRPRALRKHSKAALRTLEYLNPQKEAHRGQPAEKKRCYLCPRDQDRKTRTAAQTAEIEFARNT